MRKFICAVLVLLLCMSVILPAAADEGFVPSITYKPEPELVNVVGPDGKEYVGVIKDANGEIISYVDHGCLLITPIAHVWDDEIVVPEDVERLLLFVYNSLSDGSMQIPYEKHGEELDPADMVIRDLFDARWGCTEHPKMLEPEGVVVEITFDLGVVAEAQIFVQTYDEAADQWDPIVKTVNNGDGTVTCTFEHLCAIEFSMLRAGAAPVTVQTETKPAVLPWIILLILALVAVAAIIIVKSRKKTAA